MSCLSCILSKELQRSEEIVIIIAILFPSNLGVGKHVCGLGCSIDSLKAL